MKNIYLCHITLVFISFLFMHDSCRANTLFELNSTVGNLTAKNEINYSNSIENNRMSANNTNLFVLKRLITNELFVVYSATNSLQESKVVYLAITEAMATIDPDWMKNVTHFSDRINDANQNV
jgi:hypothetical protein